MKKKPPTLNDNTVDRLDKWSRTCAVCLHRCHAVGDGFCPAMTLWERILHWFGRRVDTCGCPACACLRCMIRQQRGARR